MTTSCCSSPRGSSTGSMSTWASYPVSAVPTSTCGRRKAAPRRCSHSTRNRRKGTVCAERSDTTVPTRTERLAITSRRWLLDPNDPEALLWLGYHYAVSGRPDLARALMDRLQQVDPLTSINLTMYGMVAMFDGNYPEALTWTQRSVDIDPANPTPRMMHALMLAANGRREEGVAMLDAVAGDTSAMAWARLAPAMACALRGERDELLRIMTPELRAAAEWDEIFAWWAADCFALVNEADAAIDFIERAVEFGFINAPWLWQYEPFLASLRSEPRFGRLMEGVQGAWRAFEPSARRQVTHAAQHGD